MSKETLKNMLQHFIAGEDEEAKQELSTVIKQKTQEIVNSFQPSSDITDEEPKEVDQDKVKPDD